MTSTDSLRRYWRIPVVGLLAAVLAFAASFVVSPTYESSTRLLVHGRDATFLSSTGEDLAAQPGVVDASLSQALLSTYAGIATGRSVATAVTDELDLDKQTPSTSPMALVSQALGWAYRCGRAFVTAGFCAPVEPREQAIRDVQEGITAQPVGTNAGSGSGQPGSYVLEVVAAGDSPAQARAITDAVAQQLVAEGNTRFQRDARTHIESLEEQVEAARGEQRARTREVVRFQTAHGISAADVQRALTAETLEKVRADLGQAQADLADTRAKLASVETSLTSIPRNQRERQVIVTGRSKTELSTNGASTVYNELQTQRSTLQAEQSGLLARVRRLERQLDGAKPLKSNGPVAELGVLQQGADLAGANVKELTTRLQQARTNAAQASVDLSRLDDASEPTYPTTPKRYIYLALGLLIGGLAGAVLTARAQRPVEDGPDDTTEQTAVSDPPLDRTNGHTAETDRDELLDLILAGRGDASWPPR